MARTTGKPSPGGRATGIGQLGELPALKGSSTLSDRLYDVLEEAIITGALEAGQRIHADDIAAHYGISRIPVREILRALDSAGWIELRPRHGAYVRERTPEELAELFEVRLILEAEAAALAAKRIGPEDVRRLEEILAAQRVALKAGDDAEVARLNTTFHEIVAAAAGNTVLAQLLERLSKRVRFYFATVAHHRGRRSLAEHAKLIDALRRNDAEAAAEVARAHVAATREAVRDLLDGTARPTAAR